MFLRGDTKTYIQFLNLLSLPPGHPNVVVFIAHGGLLGTQEAVACGVPMLTVPLFADQALNARAMSDRGVARALPLAQVNEHSWRDALTDLLTDRRSVHCTLQPNLIPSSSTSASGNENA